MAKKGTFLGEVQRGAGRFWGLPWKVKGPIIVVAVLVLLVAIGSAGDSGDKPAAASADPTEQQATNTPKPTSTPKPTETPKATATPELPSNEKQIGDLHLTVNGVTTYTEKNQFLRPEAGTYYVAVDVTAKNTGSKQYSVNPFNFKLKDSDKFTTGMASTTVEPRFAAAELVPGQEVRGFLIFKLGEGRTPVELQYQSFTGSAGVIAVTLSQ